MYGYVGAAHDWGMRPSALGLCRPEEDAAVMIAWSQTTGRMRAYEQTLQEKEIEKTKT